MVVCATVEDHCSRSDRPERVERGARRLGGSLQPRPLEDARDDDAVDRRPADDKDLRQVSIVARAGRLRVSELSDTRTGN